MMLQRPKRKKAKQVKKTPLNANQSGSPAPSQALPNGPLQVVPQRPNGHHGFNRNGKPRLPFEPAPPQSIPRTPFSSRAGPPRAPTLPPYFSPPLRVPRPDNHGVDAIPHHVNQEPALYDLICSKFDAVITSIDGESFSGDRRELGR